MNMYFTALVAPAEINNEVLKWKHFFKERFGCLAALKSPAHITLIPPFWMNEELEPDLKNAISSFSKKKKKLTIQLNGFSAFNPKVIFVDVMKNPALDLLYLSFHDFIPTLEKFPIKTNNHEFHPHISLATRDLHKRSFYEAWEIFAKKIYAASWVAEGISILRHNKKNWDVIFTSQFED